MSETDPRYIVNAPRMIHESFGEETVVIDTESGIFFNLAGSAPLIFEILQGGCRRSELSRRVSDLLDVTPEAVHAAVDEFLDELRTEGIVVATEKPSDPPTTAPDARRDGGFVLPTLRKFTDMSELLLIDPIHDLDDEGWPQRP